MINISKKSLASVVTLMALWGGELLSTKVKVINDSDDNIQVFFRGEGANSHHVETLTSKTSGTYTLTPTQLDNKNFLEAIVSKGNQGSPDWKLLGGKCKHLSANTDHTIVVEDSLMGLKASCIVIE